MGCILVGIVCAVILFVLAVHFTNECSIIWPLLMLTCFIGGIGCGLFAPVSGFHEEQIASSTKLVSLVDQTTSTGGGFLYVTISAENSYTYYVEVENKYGKSNSKAYKSQTITGTNITVIEDDNYTDATLVVYEAKPKKSFWTFGWGGPTTEYVFHVPKGTIAMNVSLG